MKKWTRWQDWVAVVVGLYAALSSIWTATSGTATTVLIVLGVLTILAALSNLAQPGVRTTEYVEVAFGILMFISPWVMGFGGMTGVATTAWVVGAITIIVGVWALPSSMKLHGTHHRPVSA